MTTLDESPDAIMEKLTPEMDAYLQYQIEHPDPDPDPNARDAESSYRNAAVFQSYAESLFGEEIWETLLDEVKDKPEYKKYLACIPAEAAFNRKGLEGFNETVYDNLHPVVEAQLLKTVESTIKEELGKLGGYYDSETYAFARMCNRGDIAGRTSTSPVNVLKYDGKSVGPAHKIASERQKDEHAAFYKLGGLIDANHGISFWLTVKQPKKSRRFTTDHGGVTCAVVDCLDDPFREGHNILGSGFGGGHVSSIESMLTCAKLSVIEAIRVNSKNLNDYIQRIRR